MSSTARDLYEVLGVPRDASADDIKRAYRRLAREHHPDVAGTDSEDHFKEIVGAYEILSDPDKRARYDAFGTTGGAPGAAGSPFADIQDIFDMFFGGGFAGGQRRRGPRSRTRRGEDLRVRTVLTFREAAFGVRRDIDVERMVSCDLCQGSGAQPGTTLIACRACGGAGEVQSMRRSVFGTVMTSAPCVTCAGSGQEIPDPCERCMGNGRLRQPASVTVDIPAGVDDGMEVRVGGNGNAGAAGGPAGDLFVELHVEPAAGFERRGSDLFTVLDITLTQAALGAEIQIEGLEGPELVSVGPGTDSGTVVRLKGKGVPNLQRRGRGDVFVTLHVVTPRDLSREERRLIEKLAEIRGERTSPREPAHGELRRPEF
jgi:molecular chaperone DnaJ